MRGWRSGSVVAIVLILSGALAGCASKSGPEPAPDPFAGAGAPITAQEAAGIARSRVVTEHPGAHLAMMIGNQVGNHTGKLAPWDVFFVDANTTEDYWYVVAGQGAVPGREAVQKLPQGFPSASVEAGWKLGSADVVALAMKNATFASLAAQPSRLTLTLQGYGQERALWHLALRSNAGAVEMSLDAATGERV